MKRIGSILLFFGGGSILLNIFGYELTALKWIYAWGPEISWLIKGGCTLLGFIICIVAFGLELAEQETKNTSQQQ